MKKLKLSYMYEGEEFTHLEKCKGFDVFVNNDESWLLIVGKDNEILFECFADCGGNVGFFKFKSAS